MADLTISDFDAMDIVGKHQEFSQYAGRVAIVVNVASEWGYAPIDYPQESAKRARLYVYSDM